MRSVADGLRISLPAGIATLAMVAIAAHFSPAGAEAVATAQPARVAMAVEVSPEPVEHLDRVTVATTFRASADVPETLRAKLDVTSVADGSSALSTSQSGFTVPSGGARAIYWVWRVPEQTEPGEYTLHLKLEGTDSGTVYGEQELPRKLLVSGR